MAAVALTLLAGTALAQATAFPGIGRAATPKEVAAWDIDVRPDFKGLPAGSGSVEKGTEIWEAKCASCHGIFGESNEVFSPLIGGTTKDDVKTGRVKRLTDPGFPGRTTLMKVPTVSTLWDYINRAMPWNAPKSLSTNEVYAVTAYLLNLGEVVPEDFTLSDKNITQVQAMLPNRNGMTTDHHLWPGKSMGGKPVDAVAVACMKDCATEAKVASFLPDHARNAHGNLAEQNRIVGAQLGADTTKPAGGAITRPSVTAEAKVAAAAPASAVSAAGPSPGPGLFARHNCTACHAIDRKVLGPSMQDVAKKHGPRADAVAYLSGKILGGAIGTWGQIPMPAQSIPKADAEALAKWIAAGGVK
jgi:cytochrome c